jgi:hypothetical protein
MTAQETTKDLIDFEAVRNHSSFSDMLEKNHPCVSSTTAKQHQQPELLSIPQKKKKINNPILVPSRVTDDTVLAINAPESPSSPECHPPTAIAQQAISRHFDLNMPWVEMLIYSEQERLRSKR